jgi:hypothetical protein
MVLTVQLKMFSFQKRSAERVIRKGGFGVARVGGRKRKRWKAKHHQLKRKGKIE